MTIHKILPKTVYEATNVCEDQLENFETLSKNLPLTNKSNGNIIKRITIWPNSTPTLNDNI